MKIIFLETREKERNFDIKIVSFRAQLDLLFFDCHKFLRFLLQHDLGVQGSISFYFLMISVNSLPESMRDLSL